jgi:hypothetical protein
MPGRLSCSGFVEKVVRERERVRLDWHANMMQPSISNLHIERSMALVPYNPNMNHGSGEALSVGALLKGTRRVVTPRPLLLRTLSQPSSVQFESLAGKGGRSYGGLRPIFLC